MANGSSSKTYEAVGNREDLTDVIFNISPENTYLLTKMGRVKAEGINHEWMNDALDPARQNAQLEMQDFGKKLTRPRRRLSNYCQIMLSEFTVSESQEAVSKAGVTSEIEYQYVKKMKELNQDLELALLTNSFKQNRNDTTPSFFGGLRYFTNPTAIDNFFNFGGNIATTGIFTLDVPASQQIQTGDMITVLKNLTTAIPAPFNTNNIYYARVNETNQGEVALFNSQQEATDGTAFPGVNSIKPTAASDMVLSLCNMADAGGVELTEDVFGDMMEKIKKQGGNPQEVIVDGKNKRQISKWTAGSQKTQPAQDKKRTLVVDVYESDFGIVTIVHHPYQTSDRVDFVEYQYLKIAPLINFHMHDPAKEGLYTRRAVSGELTMECRSPQAMGAIFNIAPGVAPTP